MSAFPSHAMPAGASRFTRLRVHLLAFLLCIIAPMASHAESEYAVKAAYLYHFTSLVKWPAGTFADDQASLVIGVVGTDPFEGGLRAGMRRKSATQRPLEVRAVKAGDVAAMRQCHMLFFPAGEPVAEAAASLQDRPVLIVSDTGGAASSGASITFTLLRKRVRLEINPTAARAAGLRISSDLLGIATLTPSP